MMLKERKKGKQATKSSKRAFERGKQVTKRKAHNNKICSYELQSLFDETNEKLTQCQAHVAELQAKVVALSHSLHMLWNQNTYLEL
ncbi:hypothetical protein V6N12_051306 [Hibiscus sabdariffa]|uniref:BZIP domain-containing protein n=1 Tax=Hibiscus sabdariffa TaxID=183260 RepID=A0ABR2GF20_9ROSI